MLKKDLYILMALSAIALGFAGMVCVVGLSSGVPAPAPVTGESQFIAHQELATVRATMVPTIIATAPAPTQMATLKATTVPSPTVTVVAGTVTPTEGAQVPKAEILDHGTDKGTYNRGEKATGYITIRNSGSTTINDITTSVSLRRSLAGVGVVTVGSKDYTVKDLNIQPGQTKRIEFSADIPKEYAGMSTAGDYDLNVKVTTGGKDIGSFKESVKVV